MKSSPFNKPWRSFDDGDEEDSGSEDAVKAQALRSLVAQLESQLVAQGFDSTAAARVREVLQESPCCKPTDAARKLRDFVV